MNFITPVFTDQTIEGINSYDFLYVKAQLENLENLMSSSSLRENLTLSLECARVGDRLVSKYEMMVVGRFYLGEDLVVILSDGFYVNLSEMIRQTLDLHGS